MKKILLLLSSFVALSSIPVTAQTPSTNPTEHEMGFLVIGHVMLDENFLVSYDFENNILEVVSKKPVTDEIKNTVKNFSEQIKGAPELFTIKLYDIQDIEKSVSEYVTVPAKQNDNQNTGQLQYETDNASYVIKKMYVVDNSMFPDQKVLVLEMQFTNKGSQPTSPWMSFALDYSASIDNGVTTDELMGANGQMDNVQNQEAVEMGDANVNPGVTVDAIIGYDYTDPSKVVKFILRTSQIAGDPKGFKFTP